MARITEFRSPKQVPNSKQYNPRQANADISDKDLNTLIYNQGIRVKVYKTLWCPNVKSIDGVEHNIECPLCHGTEFIDVDPVETFMYIQGQQREQLTSPENLGSQLEEATAMATFISGIELSYYSKVDLMDFTQINKELIQRQKTGPSEPIVTAFQPTAINIHTGVISIPDSVDLLQVRVNDILIDSLGKRFLILQPVDNIYGQKTVTIGINKQISLGVGAVIIRPNIDRLMYKAVTVDVIMDSSGQRYYPEKDFMVDRNGDIAWVNYPDAIKPADTAIYSIYYNAVASYRTIRALHSDRYGSYQTKEKAIKNIEFPQQWIIKKLVLFKKSDSETGQNLDPNHVFIPESQQ